MQGGNGVALQTLDSEHTMGAMKKLYESKQSVANPTTCKRRKYAEKQSAINSSFVITRNTLKLTKEPVFCTVCQAWHVEYA